jgi:hypothetical protein
VSGASDDEAAYTKAEEDSGLYRKHILAVIIGSFSGGALFAIAMLLRSKLFKAQTMHPPGK